MAVVTRLNQLEDLAREKSSERRRALLREVTDLFFETPPEEGQAAATEFENVLTLLAEQTAEEARQELSERFADSPMAPHGLVLKLAQDAIQVAAPILTRSSVLSEQDLVSLADSVDQSHLQAISKRDTVPEQVSARIVQRGDDHTLATLVRNEGAQLSRESFETVTERAERSPVIQGPLVERSDTPTDLLSDLMLTVENRLRERILERFNEVDPAELEVAMAKSHDRLASRMKDDKALAEAEKFIRTKAVRKQLDGNLLVRLLRDKEYLKFQVGFAEMADIDVTAARRAIDQPSIDPLALICKAAGFEKALFVTLAILRHENAQDAFKDAKALGSLYDAVDAGDADRALRFYRMRKQMAA